MSMKAQKPDVIFEFVDWAEELAGVAKGSAQRILKEFGYEMYSMDHEGFPRMDEIMTTGHDLFFASKKEQGFRK